MIVRFKRGGTMLMNYCITSLQMPQQVRTSNLNNTSFFLFLSKTMSDYSALTALSPLDGRYQGKLDPLRNWLSEYALIKHRVQVEIAWLISLAQESKLPQVAPLSSTAQSTLESWVTNFAPTDAQTIKEIETETNHDVKAVEYWLKNKMQADATLTPYLEWVHFACTSEDINNTAYSLMVQGARRCVILPKLHHLLMQMQERARTHADQPMLARTHGQSASPTTVGKEFANIAARLTRAIDVLEAVPLRAKMNGAVGNYNAHVVAFPNLDWPQFSQNIIEQKLGLMFNPMTTQIDPHDDFAQLFDAISRINVILIDTCRDLWGYIALGYFSQLRKDKEVGSSTMPHKINPIDFENAEGNLGVANALLRFMSDKLPISRWQRDLTDSTVLRNIGVALGHSLLAYDSFSRGLNKLTLSAQVLNADLDDAWEVLAEPIQTVMRKYGLPNPYEHLKNKTRGQAITREKLHELIKELAIPETEKTALLALTPARYTGLAAQLAQSGGQS